MPLEQNPTSTLRNATVSDRLSVADDGRPLQVAFLLVDRFPEFALSCMIATLRLANELSGRALYGWRLIAENGRSAISADGRMAAIEHGLDHEAETGAVLVLAGGEVDGHTTAAQIDYLRDEDRRGTPIGAACSGAYLLVRAGLLSGGRLSLDGEAHGAAEAVSSGLVLMDRGFSLAGRFMTAADTRASLDLMLWLIEQRNGRTLARRVCEWIIARGAYSAVSGAVPYVADGGEVTNEYVTGALLKMRLSLDQPLHIADLAEEMGITSRQLQRLFRKHLNRQPKQALTQLRLERARDLLVETEWPVTRIALTSGFQSLAHFGRVFREAYGQSPRSLRTGEAIRATGGGTPRPGRPG